MVCSGVTGWQTSMSLWEHSSAGDSAIFTVRYTSQHVRPDQPVRR